MKSLEFSIFCLCHCLAFILIKRKDEPPQCLTTNVVFENGVCLVNNIKYTLKLISLTVDGSFIIK